MMIEEVRECVKVVVIKTVVRGTCGNDSGLGEVCGMGGMWWNSRGGGEMF